MTVSMQKISSIHKLILKIQQILRPHELNDHAKPQIIEITFSFPQFGRSCKKSVHPIYLLLRCSQFQSPVTRLAIPTFDHAHLNIWKSCNLGLYYLGPYLKNKVFTKYGICAGTTNNINFHYRTDSVKIMTKFFFLILKTLGPF